MKFSERGGPLRFLQNKKENSSANIFFENILSFIRNRERPPF